MLYIGGGCAALLLLTCCCTGGGTGLFWWLGWWPFGGTAPDLIYVHDGVAGFVSVRVADVYKNTTFKDQAGKVDQKKTSTRNSPTSNRNSV